MTATLLPVMTPLRVYTVENVLSHTAVKRVGIC